MATTLDGSGLRFSECLDLRVKDVDLDKATLTVRQGKGGKDRITMLPRTALDAVRVQLGRNRLLYDADRAEGRPGVALADGLERKYPSAGKQWSWHWVFPPSRCPPTLDRAPFDDTTCSRTVCRGQ